LPVLGHLFLPVTFQDGHDKSRQMGIGNGGSFRLETVGKDRTEKGTDNCSTNTNESNFICSKVQLIFLALDSYAVGLIHFYSLDLTSFYEAKTRKNRQVFPVAFQRLVSCSKNWLL